MEPLSKPVDMDPPDRVLVLSSVAEPLRRGLTGWLMLQADVAEFTAVRDGNDGQFPLSILRIQDQRDFVALAAEKQLVRKTTHQQQPASAGQHQFRIVAAFEGGLNIEARPFVTDRNPEAEQPDQLGDVDVPGSPWLQLLTFTRQFQKRGRTVFLQFGTDLQIPVIESVIQRLFQRHAEMIFPTGVDHIEFADRTQQAFSER